MVENKSIKKLKHNLNKAINARNNCSVSNKRTLYKWCLTVEKLKSEIFKKAKHPALKEF